MNLVILNIFYKLEEKKCCESICTGVIAIALNKSVWLPVSLFHYIGRCRRECERLAANTATVGCVIRVNDRLAAPALGTPVGRRPREAAHWVKSERGQCHGDSFLQFSPPGTLRFFSGSGSDGCRRDAPFFFLSEPPTTPCFRNFYS